MSYPIEPRPPKPLYVPTWWEKRFPWLLDYLVLLDPDPLWARLAPLLAPVHWLIAVLVGPPAALLDWLALRIAALSNVISSASWRVLSAMPMPGLAMDLLWLRPVEPFRPIEHDAQAVVKRQYKTVRRWSYIAAFTIHACVIIFWPAAEAQAFSSTSEPIGLIEIPPEIVIPPAPPDIPRPAVPVVGPANIDEDVTIALTTFADNPVITLPPPPEPAVVEESDEPAFTSFTVAPSILNRQEIGRLLIADYPPLLKDAGVGGQVIVWFRISEEGLVEETRIARTSGHASLDQSALRVAERFRFSPALQRDQKIAVWVQLPINFTVR